MPAEVRSLAPEVHWRQIVATRNRLMHAYLTVDLATVWNIVSAELPALRPALEALLQRL